jgi:nucleoprotein TPR
MMKTRRKSKAAAQAGQDTDGEAHEEFSVSVPDDIDLDALSEIVPDTNFTSISQEGIIALYRFLLQQAEEGRAIVQELDEAKAEIEKREVELDQALQDKESVSRESEAQVESVHKELAQLKQERDQLGIVLFLSLFCRNDLSSF